MTRKTRPAAPPPRRAGRASGATSSRPRCRSRSRRRRASATPSPSRRRRRRGAPRGRAARGRQQPAGESRRRRRRRDVDEEDPVPVERRRCRMPPRSTPIDPPPAATKPKTPIAFARSAGSVNSVMISESATAETTAPPSPCTARAPTSISCVCRQAARERGEREERDADQEQAAVAEEVAEPAAEQEEAAEREQVGVHDPRERRLGEAEVLADRRQGDVHDRHVEDDHQVARGRARAAPASVCGCPWSSGFYTSVESTSPRIRPSRPAELIGRASLIRASAPGGGVAFSAGIAKQRSYIVR